MLENRFDELFHAAERMHQVARSWSCTASIIQPCGGTHQPSGWTPGHTADDHRPLTRDDCQRLPSIPVCSSSVESWLQVILNLEVRASTNSGTAAIKEPRMETPLHIDFEGVDRSVTHTTLSFTTWPSSMPSTCGLSVR